MRIIILISIILFSIGCTTMISVTKEEQLTKVRESNSEPNCTKKTEYHIECEELAVNLNVSTYMPPTPYEIVRNNLLYAFAIKKYSFADKSNCALIFESCRNQIKNLFQVGAFSFEYNLELAVLNDINIKVLAFSSSENTFTSVAPAFRLSKEEAQKTYELISDLNLETFDQSKVIK